ncbi:hypothetical protein E3N88_43244 [Mikania micrantha]|uniref:Reverse transcriptase Ty1/copia-type domain-containing protein n=1 Tax=Mikania micrantha TaxID=192012 RepID=A0A5N6LFH1_9ASTR|nr:hypothetical protein E3N88_43244 [Mikania micrantha]
MIIRRKFILALNSAFLNGPLQEEVFVVQPPGFEKLGEEHKVYKLHKALYGLKQAPRAWYERIDTYLKGKGYKRSSSEPTLYVKKVHVSELIIVYLYADDIVYTSSSSKLLSEFKNTMVDEFDIPDLGDLHYFLGLEITERDDGMFISQKKYAVDLLKRFGMWDCKAMSIPMKIGEKLSTENEDAQVDGYKFRRTISYGLWYGRTKEIRLKGYTDSDWAGSLEDRKSISANVFSLGTSAVSWSSKKQQVVALSSTEAEYIALNAAAYAPHTMQQNPTFNPLPTQNNTTPSTTESQNLYNSIPSSSSAPSLDTNSPITNSQTNITPPPPQTVEPDVNTSSPSPTTPPPPPSTRPQRDRKPNPKYYNSNTVNNTTLHPIPPTLEPTTHIQASKDPKWRNAMDAEFNALDGG